MIAWLFFAFLGVGLILAIAGFAIDIPVLTFIGSIMIFLLGMQLMTTGTEYQVGTYDDMIYGDNLSSNWNNGTVSDVTSPYLLSVNSTAVYEHFDDTTNDRLGWFLMIGGALAFCAALFLL